MDTGGREIDVVELGGVGRQMDTLLDSLGEFIEGLGHDEWFERFLELSESRESHRQANDDGQDDGSQNEPNGQISTTGGLDRVGFRDFGGGDIQCFTGRRVH